MPKLFLVETVV